jgi:hypothetical protein
VSARPSNRHQLYAVAAHVPFPTSYICLFF